MVNVKLTPLDSLQSNLCIDKLSVGQPHNTHKIQQAEPGGFSRLMDNLVKHFTHQPPLLVLFVVSLIVLVTSIPYFLAQQKRYGSAFTFASSTRKNFAGLSVLLLIVLSIYGLTPYVPPSSKEIVIVLGNTKNTPLPKISQEVALAIEGTMLQHKGEDKEELADSIKIVSAVKNPRVVRLDSADINLKEIGKNSSNAKRSAAINVKAIEEKIGKLQPTDNGADYLEAILKARDNAAQGSRIIVIGSGLSDNGDLNFSKSNILTNEESRQASMDKLREKYGSDYLETYIVDFYGLGDSVSPQEPLSSKQKTIVRDIYRSTIRSLGGTADIHTSTLVGDAVNTSFVVGTTDTGCGDIGLIFDDDNLKFVSDQAVFSDPLAAKNSLASIRTIWDKYKDTIQLIQVDGYIAHYPGPDTLSQKRADLVKKVLVELGVPADKITATGKGFGPNQLDAQNRMVKVNISRSSEQCEN